MTAATTAKAKETHIGTIEIQTTDEEYHVFEIVQRGPFWLVAGTVCNVGLLDHYKHRIDFCFSFNENLSAFIETIEDTLNT
jgi:hypothetical protein